VTTFLDGEWRQETGRRVAFGSEHTRLLTPTLANSTQLPDYTTTTTTIIAPGITPPTPSTKSPLDGSRKLEVDRHTTTIAHHQQAALLSITLKNKREEDGDATNPQALLRDITRVQEFVDKFQKSQEEEDMKRKTIRKEHIEVS